MKRFVCILIAAMAVCGCREQPKPNAPPPTPPPVQEKTTGAEIGKRISQRVLHGIPGRGRLARARASGILRVALPPPEPPFQQRDDSTNTYTGFNVELAREIAKVLPAKANFELLQSNSAEAALALCRSGKFDLVFLPGVRRGPAAAEIRYFLANPDNAWRTLCAAGPDDSLRRAVENTLGYLNDSEIFFNLHNTFFAPAPARKNTAPVRK